MCGRNFFCQPSAPLQKKNPQESFWGFKEEAPGSDLLSHGLSHTTIGAGAFHFRVRDGIGWDHAAVSAREAVLQVALLRLACIRTRDVTCDELSHGVDACRVNWAREFSVSPLPADVCPARQLGVI